MNLYRGQTPSSSGVSRGVGCWAGKGRPGGATRVPARLRERPGVTGRPAGVPSRLAEGSWASCFRARLDGELQCGSVVWRRLKLGERRTSASGSTGTSPGRTEGKVSRSTGQEWGEEFMGAHVPHQAGRGEEVR